MSAIIIDSEIVHYEVLGRGRPLIFLHGWVGSWRYWIPAMQKTSIGFRAYALDLWGFGDTAKGLSDYSLDRQISLVTRFLHEMGMGKVVLIGHGLGAAVALQFAQTFPRAVDRLMAVSLPFSFAAINQRLQSADLKNVVDWLTSANPVLEAAQAEAAKTDPQAVTATFSELQLLDLLEQVIQLPIPSLYVHGANDQAIAAPPQEKLAELGANAHQLTFTDSGHFPMLEEMNKFNRLLVDFLALQSGESPQNLQLKEEWKRRVR
jgi:pimeloyl-ACP methyl ester carboxylesterase